MKNKVLTKIVLLILILCLTVALSGCGMSKKTEEDGAIESSTEVATEDTSKKDLVAFEYMDKLSPENTVEEINEIIGFEGELTDEKYNEYTWNITDDTKITATYYSSKTATIKIDIDNKLLKDDKADLSCAKDLKAEINSTNGITYDDFVSKIGTNGYIVEKSSSSTKYKWVNKNGGYLTGTFSNSSGKCTFFSAFA